MSEKPVQAEADDFDSPRKEALERFFAEFIDLFVPHAYREIDWSRGYEFLDQELQAIVRDAELGRRWADRLVKVWRKGGEEEWVLIHLEIQGQVDPDFAKRPPEKIEFERAKSALERELKMPYITSWERDGERRGQLQAFRQSVLDLLEERFGTVSESTASTLDTIDDSDLMRRLVIAASTSSKPADFEKLLPKRRAARQKDA